MPVCKWRRFHYKGTLTRQHLSRSLAAVTAIFSITANLGDTKSTITHPATTTHGRLTPEQRSESGIDDGLVRLAVGLESVDDLQADLARGLASL